MANLAAFVQRIFHPEDLYADGTGGAFFDPSHIWGEKDFLARRNLLTYSEDLSATGHTNTSTTVATATNPDGATTNCQLTASGANGTHKTAVTTIATSYIYRVQLKRKTGTGNIDISVDGTNWVTQTITSSWAWYTVTQTGIAGTSNPGIRIVTSADAVYVSNEMIARADTKDQTYQAVTDWTTEQYAWAAANPKPWLRRNRLLSTATLSTQTVTAVTANPLTVSFTGTGTITFSTAYSGSLVGTGSSNRVSVTFTPSAGNLVCTVSGSVTLAQVENGSSATAYQAVGTSWDATYTALAQAAGYPISLYSGRAGTTAVSGPDTVVGVVLDGSKRYVLGASDLISNGTFNTDAAGWSTNGSATIGVDSPANYGIANNSTGNIAKITSNGANTSAYQAITTVVGKWYKITASCYPVNYSAGFRVGTTTGGSDNLDQTAVFANVNFWSTLSVYFLATATTTYIRPYPSAAVGRIAYFDSISVVESVGNHVAAPTDAARPILRLDANHNWYLQFDGSDDALENSAASALNVGAAGNVTVLACVDSTVESSGTKVIVGLGKSAVSQNYALLSNTTRRVGFSNLSNYYGTYTTIGLPAVFGFKSNGSGVIVRDGVTDKYTGSEKTGANTNYNFDIGANNNGTNVTAANYAGNIYGIIVALQDMSAAKYARCYRWLWNKGGGVM